jgi:long-subunit acyl-CoA synthetase (AMP-forming)
MDSTKRKLIKAASEIPATNYHQGFVTSAQKLNRKVILNKYQKDVDQAYKKAGN